MVLSVSTLSVLSVLAVSGMPCADIIGGSGTRFKHRMAIGHDYSLPQSASTDNNANGRWLRCDAPSTPSRIKHQYRLIRVFAWLLSELE